jgi:outer membrane immunogenic protein
MSKIPLIGIVALAALIGGPAVAADMAVKAPPLPPPPVYSWTGCYIGINGGGLWAHKDWTGPLGNQVGDHNVDGGLFGGQVGCDYQAPGHVVIGIQGDYDGANATGSNSNLTTTHIYQTHITALSSVTGRIGYSWAQFLGYVKGGGAWERDGYSTAVLATGVVDANSSGTRSGYTVGVGGEYAFTNFLSGFVEYDYYGFGTRTDTFFLTGGPLTIIGGPTTINYRISETKNVFKVGLNLRWNAAAIPAMARN